MKVVQVVKILPLFIITVLAHCVAAFNATAGDNTYKASLAATCIQTNKSGRLVETCYSTREILRACARENGYTNANDLQLVYDVDEDSVRVVRVSDGAVVCVILSFEGGQSIANANGTEVERLTFVFLPDVNEAKGSAKVTVKYRNNPSPTTAWPGRPAFSLRGSFQYSTPPTDAGGPAICSGFLATGGKFVPANPPDTGGGDPGST